jgi:hypothetical protein
MALEADSDAPDKSPVLSKYPKFFKDHHALDFVCDTIRMASGGGVEAFDVDQMMEMDMDAHHHGGSVTVGALSTVADALPGLGIVAAVLGVVITMGSLGGPARRDWKKGGRGAGRNVSGYLDVLRGRGAGGQQHDQNRGRRTFLLPSAARDHRGVHEGLTTGHGGRIWPPFAYPGTCGRAFKRRRSTSRARLRKRPQPEGKGHRGGSEDRPRSSSRRRPRTAGTTAGPGKWRMRISSPP